MHIPPWPLLVNGGTYFLMHAHVLLIYVEAAFVLLFLSTIPVIKRIWLFRPVSRLRTIRWYLASIIVFLLVIFAEWVINVTVLTVTFYPLITGLFALFMTIRFGSRVTFITFLYLLYPILYYLFTPRYHPSARNMHFFWMLLLTIVVNVGIGFFIRHMQSTLMHSIGQLRTTLLDTSSRLALVRSEESILKSIDKAALALSSSQLSTKSTLRIIGREGNKLLDSQMAGIGLCTDGSAISHVTVSPLVQKNRRRSIVAFEEMLTLFLERCKSPTVFELRKYSELTVRPSSYYSFTKVLIAPIIHQRKLIGGMAFANHPHKPEFTADDKRRVRLFIAHAALTIITTRQYEALQRVIAERERFTSVASHELKTPLSTIKLYTQMLQREDLPATALKRLHTIDDEASKMSGLVSDLLDFSRIQQGKIHIQQTTVDLAKLCQEQVKIIQELYPEYQFRYQTALQRALVSADTYRLQQVVSNILTNAVKYSAKRSKISLLVSETKHQYRVAIADEGPGISSRKQSMIFEAFYQTNDQLQKKEKIEGLGLGLFIAKQIVLLHKGKIWVESSEGKGATFYISLPKLANGSNQSS